jgi:hypothetical protein
VYAREAEAGGKLMQDASWQVQVRICVCMPLATKHVHGWPYHSPLQVAQPGMLRCQSSYSSTYIQLLRWLHLR